MSDETPQNDPESDEYFELSQSAQELSQKLVEVIGIDEVQAEKAIRIVQSYSGPIPFAEELTRYNQVSPQLGTDLARDYLRARSHERECDLAAIDLANRDAGRKENWLSYARRGQTLGFASQVIFVASALAAMALGHLYVAGLFIAPPALGVVTQFIKGFRSESDSPRASQPRQPHREKTKAP